MSKHPVLDNLRYAAHVRHAAVNYACWWWNPPMLVMSRLTHRAIVDGFYDSLEDAVDEEEPK